MVVLVGGRVELEDLVPGVVVVPELQPLESVGLVHHQVLEVPSDFHLAIVRVLVCRDVCPPVCPVDLGLDSAAFLAVLWVEVPTLALDLAASGGLVVDV